MVIGLTRSHSTGPFGGGFRLSCSDACWNTPRQYGSCVAIGTGEGCSSQVLERTLCAQRLLDSLKDRCVRGVGSPTPRPHWALWLSSPYPGGPGWPGREGMDICWNIALWCTMKIPILENIRHNHTCLNHWKSVKIAQSRPKSPKVAKSRPKSPKIA